jgi:uncharacterized protein (TIGR02452 family)
VLPSILAELPGLDAYQSEKNSLDTLSTLDPSRCPKYSTKALVKVINEDTFNAAIQLASSISPASCNSSIPVANSRVAVLNLASDKNPGGGWRSGAGAQEESLCYRSSLALSLHRRYYPFGPEEGIYTPDVVIIRSAMGNGHSVLTPAISPADLPVVSVLSVAAIRRPRKKTVPTPEKGGPDTAKSAFADESDKELTKSKMRLILRMAAVKGHSSLVLGALGCGAFKNPPEDVANCWLEVLKEDEFSGGWWRQVWFAILDRKSEGNFEVFRRILGGLAI